MQLELGHGPARLDVCPSLCHQEAGLLPKSHPCPINDHHSLLISQVGEIRPVSPTTYKDPK